MKYLLDTNILSELQKGPRADPAVRAWFSLVETSEVHLSVLALGEIRVGIERLRPRDPARSTALETSLRELVQRFGDRLLPVTAEIADRWGRLGARRPLPVADSLMAATAITHGLTFVTRNRKDVADLGVDVLNPFEA